MTPSQDLAAKAYGAYGAVTNFRNFQGDPMPAWDELPVKIRAAWAKAATAAWTQAVRDLAPLLGRDERELFALLADGEAGR